MIDIKNKFYNIYLIPISLFLLISFNTYFFFNLDLNTFLLQICLSIFSSFYFINRREHGFYIAELYQQFLVFNLISIFIPSSLSFALFDFINISIIYYTLIILFNSFLFFILFNNIFHFYFKQVSNHNSVENYFAYHFLFKNNIFIKPVIKSFNLKYFICNMSMLFIFCFLVYLSGYLDIVIRIICLIGLIPLSFFIYSFINHTVNIIFNLLSPISVFILSYTYTKKEESDTIFFHNSCGYFLSFKDNTIHNDSIAAFQNRDLKENKISHNKYFFNGKEIILTQGQISDIINDKIKLKNIVKNINNIESF